MSRNSLLFSVVIPTFNREALLKTSVDSVLAQEFENYELIVVDDGSTDNTECILRGNRERLTVLRQERKGPGAARNLGAQHAKGDYLAFLDSDDVWFPWTLSTYAEIVESHKPSFIAGRPLIFSGGGTAGGALRADIDVRVFQDYLSSSRVWPWWGASSFVISRTSFQACGGFAALDANGEDADLALRLAVAPRFVQVVEPRTFAYRQHDGSAIANFRKTVIGARMQIERELEGRYPGGVERSRERRRILSRHLRPISVECLNRGVTKEAWTMYRDTLLWHLQLGKWKYLLGFPVKALIGCKQP